jgi:methionyl-tRNA synthetase
MEETINFEDFLKVDLRVGTVVEAEAVEGSNKLLRLLVDLGKAIGKRQILSGIAKQYLAEEMMNKQIVVVVNLEPREMMGMISEGMILAGGEEEIALLNLDKKVENGTRIH